MALPHFEPSQCSPAALRIGSRLLAAYEALSDLAMPTSLASLLTSLPVSLCAMARQICVLSYEHACGAHAKGLVFL